jgi:hypothetical protein
MILFLCPRFRFTIQYPHLLYFLYYFQANQDSPFRVSTHVSFLIMSSTSIWYTYPVIVSNSSTELVIRDLGEKKKKTKKKTYNKLET